ncbi:hypothetical protein E2C01_038635 [Portunus trituberculatus]|uniref:Uncharacterized protein n=1 Tax=Portunus trituberculatus TaxID=210409 RepID=A0A5B7FIJ0_PORTR|nr:hypothetical protein [Portunus trituberculatus]
MQKQIMAYVAPKKIVPGPSITRYTRTLRLIQEFRPAKVTPAPLPPSATSSPLPDPMNILA